MRRLMLNRWWTFVLALVLSVVGVVSLPAASWAVDGTGGLIGDGSSDPIGSSPGAPDPSGAGDPDSPSNSGRTGSARQSLNGGRAGIFGMHSTGDARVSSYDAVWMMRVRIALSTFRVYYLRF